MRVAVLGAGNGGVAAAFDSAQHGHEVSLCATPEFGTNVVAVNEAGGIYAGGDLEGFAPIRYAGPDAAEAMEGAELVLLVGPAYGIEPQRRGRVASDRGKAVLVCPGSCAGRSPSSARLGSSSTMTARRRRDQHAALRGAGDRARRDQRLPEADHRGLPRRASAQGRDRLYDLVKDVWPAVEKADSVFQTTLQNGNPVIHPAVTLLNAGLLERTGGDFLFYEEGVTEAVGRLIEAVDNERLAIAAALGVSILSEPEIGASQGYMLEDNYSTAYSTAPGFLGIKAQSQLDHRYLTEDVGYSLVFLADLATRLAVPTPVIDSLITITSVVLARDFRAEGVRT